MSSTVQYNLEAMLPELDDLEQKGLFSKVEIKQIIKKRTELENAVAKRIPQKHDFVRYIEYESMLESLRLKRRTRILSTLKQVAKEQGEDERQVVWKSSVSDHSIKQRIHFLYDRALKKFPADVALWKMYIDWCKKMEASKAVAKAFGRAIQLHPTKPIFWILAAAWEFEDQTNISSARKLLQRAIRVNPDSRQLWQEYFKLELSFVEKARARRFVLFGKRAEEEREEILLDVDGKGQDPLEQAKIVLDMQVPESNDVQKEFFEGAVPKAIYKSAIKAIPNDLDFRLGFLEIYLRYPNWTQSGRDEVYESLKDFDDARARAIVAGRHVSGMGGQDAQFPQRLKLCLKDFNAALMEAPSAELVDAYRLWLHETKSSVTEPNIVKALEVSERKLIALAKETNIVSESLWLDLDVDQGLKHYPHSWILWEKKMGSLSTTQEWKQALQALKKSRHLYQAWEKYWTWLQDYPDEQQEALRFAIKLFAKHAELWDIFHFALNHLDQDFIQECREKYIHDHRFHLALAKFEQDQSQPSSNRIKQAFESAVTAQPTLVEPWMAYLTWELENDALHSLSLFQRAQKHVSDQEELMEKWNQLRKK